MRLLFLFVALLLSSVAAPAQSLPTTHPPDTLALPPVAAAPLDSAAALHRLFVAKRNLRTILVVGTVLTGGFSLAANSIFSSRDKSSLSYAAGQTRTVGLTALFGTAELIYFRQYSRKKEQLAQLTLAQHKLSPELKHHLKPRYFKGSALFQAQANPVPTPAVPAVLSPPTPPVGAAPTAVDTAAALHRLFDQRRHNGHVTLGAGAALLATSGAALAIGTANNSLGPAFIGILGTVVSLPVLISGTVRTIAHSKGRERRVLRAWQQHRLPRRWARRALVPEYTQLQKLP